MRRAKHLMFLLVLALVAMLALPGCTSATKSASGGGTATEQDAPVSGRADDVDEKDDESGYDADSDEGDDESDELEGDEGDDESDELEGDEGYDESDADEDAETDDRSDDGFVVDEDGEYTSKDEVALYLHLYGHLPSNYITKGKARDAGWQSKYSSLGDACPGKSIGGDKFSNREGNLPNAKGRVWRECDIDFDGWKRNAKRIVYSNDGLIYYTDDHYNTFERLY